MTNLTTSDRHHITPFIDWVVDNGLTDIKPMDLYKHMDQYLTELQSSKDNVKNDIIDNLTEITVVTNIDDGHACLLGLYKSYRYAQSIHGKRNNNTFTTNIIDCGTIDIPKEDVND